MNVSFPETTCQHYHVSPSHVVELWLSCDRAPNKRIFFLPSKEFYKPKALVQQNSALTLAKPRILFHDF